MKVYQQMKKQFYLMRVRSKPLSHPELDSGSPISYCYS